MLSKRFGPEEGSAEWVKEMTPADHRELVLHHFVLSFEDDSFPFSRGCLYKLEVTA
jgi:hypothetical protein